MIPIIATEKVQLNKGGTEGRCAMNLVFEVKMNQNLT